MKTIDEDIKNGQFRPCYLLFGEEAYLKKQYKDKLVRAVAAEGDTLNFSSFQGKETNPAKLIDLAETLPFLAERRVILVEDSGFFKNSCDILADYLPKMSESSCFIFVESEVDKRTKTFKAIKKAGAAIEFGVQGEALLTRWVLGRIGRENKKITKSVLQLFLSRAGSDMSNIDRELEKLLCYTWKKDVIEEADVKAVVTQRLENQIFDMVDAISGHRQERALELYDDLLALKEAPMKILYLIMRQFRILLQVKELSRKGYAGADLAKKIGVPGFALRKYIAQEKSFTREQILASLEDGAAAEEDVKTGRLNDKIAVEILIVRYSRQT